MKRYNKSKSTLELGQQRDSSGIQCGCMDCQFVAEATKHGSGDEQAVKELVAYRILQQDGHEHGWQLG